MAKINTEELNKQIPNEELKQVEEDPKGDMYEALLNRINELEKMVSSTTDTNKLKEYNDSLKVLNNFSFSIRLFPTEKGNFPVIKWRTLENYVGNEGKDVRQTIEITYLEEGKEKKEKLNLVDFSRILIKSEHMFAKKITNLNGSNVYIMKTNNPLTHAEYYVMKPESDVINVTLEYNGQEITILSTYLNA